MCAAADIECVVNSSVCVCVCTIYDCGAAVHTFVARYSLSTHFRGEEDSSRLVEHICANSLNITVIILYVYT